MMIEEESGPEIGREMLAATWHAQTFIAYDSSTVIGARGGRRATGLRSIGFIGNG
jgi:hypothetical protein